MRGEPKLEGRRTYRFQGPSISWFVDARSPEEAEVIIRSNLGTIVRTSVFSDLRSKAAKLLSLKTFNLEEA